MQGSGREHPQPVRVLGRGLVLVLACRPTVVLVRGLGLVLACRPTAVLARGLGWVLAFQLAVVQGPALAEMSPGQAQGLALRVVVQKGPGMG